MKQNKIFTVKNVVLIGMFSALAAILETIQMSVPFAPPFYKLDFAELPVLIGAFAMGPVPAVMIAIVKNILKLLIKGTSTYYVGELGNIIGSCFFSVPAALIYRRNKTKKTAMVALAAGVCTAIVGAIFVNCFITLPFYAKVAFGGIENIIAMGTKINPAITNLPTFAAFAIVPFNLLKCSLNAFVTALVYKHVSVIIHSDAGARARKPETEKG
jgi:ECF transporter S component (folate family)